MTYDQFLATLTEAVPPQGLPSSLRALWHERSGQGDWHQAHALVESLDSATAAWVHAYLHRREGDRSNAAYWYRQAGQPFPSSTTLDDEWEVLVNAFLGEGRGTRDEG